VRRCSICKAAPYAWRDFLDTAKPNWQAWASVCALRQIYPADLHLTDTPEH